VAPAVFTVTTFADAGAGSFRQAVNAANASPGADTIQFQLDLPQAMEIKFTSSQVIVSDPLTIVGPGQELLVLSGNSSRRMLVVNAPLTVSGLFFTAGNATDTASPSPGLGGAILSTAALTLDDCGFGGNFSANGGGAICHTGPSLTLNRCYFFANQAGNPAVGQGGAVLASGTVSMQSCYLQQNSVIGNGAGGAAVCLTGGTLTLENCGFQTNFAKTSGFGGAVKSAGPVTATNCTFDNNNADHGGGLYLTAGGTLWNCTVAFNGGFGKGGGVHGDVILESTIVSNNLSGTGPDVFGAVTAKNCALGSSAGFSSYTDQGGNLPFGSNLQFRNSISGIYGGTTFSMPIYPTSPCKNKGSNPGGLTTDVRGFGHARTVGSAPDIGSYEIQPPPKVTVRINDGSAQRSGIIQVGITLSTGYPMFGTGDTLELRRVSDNALVTLDLGGPYPMPWTPWSVSLWYSFVGGPVDGKSLADGVYVLKVFSAEFTDEIGQKVDGNGDGIGGDDYVSPLTGPGRIHRLFGDADGDGDVDATDFAAFRSAFGGASVAFDFDGDGDVDAADFGQFRARFGMSI
jgi:hypothetical protein